MTRAGSSNGTAVLSADRVLDDHGVLRPGWISFASGRITGTGAGTPPNRAQHLDGLTLVPGFVDVHQHGGGGAAYTDGPDAAVTALRTHRRHGTTTSVASLVTDTVEALEQQVVSLAGLVQEDELAGIHLEGPWLSELHCGAHDTTLLRDPVWAEVERVLDAGRGAVRMVTLATERPGALDTVRELTRRGVVAAAGHSDATYAQASEAIRSGVSVATHLFNAERAVHHREPGLALALLRSERVVVELIADGVHVHPAVLRTAMEQAAGRFVLVTDAMAAAGAPDGAYRLGPLQVQVRDGRATLAGKDTIAGSTLTLDRAVRYAVHEVGIPLEEALTAVTAAPARLLGRNDLGSLVPGARADLVALDDDLQVRAVWRRGHRCDEQS
ncbi:N-acetylglucosamine-6-phosphate deacetylase [Kocuria sp. CNJ-770]|uniref:N-acetylglucosamine-6-phosphate deacetylase n=1 Tax=Kocuria oceani TaxID=988827 RepID=A0ABV9TLT2_9MICC|nr:MULTISPECIES: N-acetylglucosamine-6-phosphate deacetylase [Kocuria]OLT12109.1 N-acetylglucosamine-6-phosphate deacetylase [Kocuria sp. CNJ-770]